MKKRVELGSKMNSSGVYKSRILIKLSPLGYIRKFREV